MRKDRTSAWVIVTVGLVSLFAVDAAQAKHVDIKQSLTTPELRDHCGRAGGTMEYDGTGGAVCYTNCHGGPGNAQSPHCAVSCQGGRCSGEVPDGRSRSRRLPKTIRGVLGSSASPARSSR
jgi:hypothetical protein